MTETWYVGFVANSLWAPMDRGNLTSQIWGLSIRARAVKAARIILESAPNGNCPIAPGQGRSRGHFGAFHLNTIPPSFPLGQHMVEYPRCLPGNGYFRAVIVLSQTNPPVDTLK